MCKTYSFLWPDGFFARPVSWIYYIATVALILLLWQQYLKKAYKTSWFDISKRGWLNKLQWPDIAYLINHDPLEYVPTFRAGWSFQALKDFIVLILAFAIWIAGIKGLRVLEDKPTKENVELATFLIGLLGFAGASAKVVYEWRLKARSEE